MKRIYILVLLLCSFSITYAQKTSFTGQVLDKENGEPLIGVSIVVKGSSSGTISDLDGKFTIQAEKGDVLVVSNLGYMQQEIEIGDSPIYKYPWLRKPRSYRCYCYGHRDEKRKEGPGLCCTGSERR